MIYIHIFFNMLWIYRKDQCEFCLCLDGEMFCWWQDCPPTMEGPCRDRGPFSPCISIPTNPQQTSTSSTASSAKPNTTSSSTSTLMTSKESSSETSGSTTDNLTDPSAYTEDTFSSESPEISISEPKYCVIMGRNYGVGDKLPHDTGNCIECVCGQGAKVTCSPNQCSPAGDEINDYRAAGPRQPLPDAF